MVKNPLHICTKLADVKNAPCDEVHQLFPEIFISMNANGTFNVRDKSNNDLTKNFLIYIDKISKEIVVKMKK